MRFMITPMRKCMVAMVLLLSAAALAQNSGSDFDKLVDEYFDFFFQFHPTAGTAAGFHQYDTKLEDYSRPALGAETAALKQWQRSTEQCSS